MANRCYLVGHDSSRPRSPDDDRGSQLLAANYQIPIMWLTLFTADDLTMCTAETMDGAGTVSTVTSPTLLTTAEAGVKRSLARAAVIRRVVPVHLHSHVDEWFSFLSAVESRYLQLEVFELWCMAEPDDFMADLSAYLGALDNPDAAAWPNVLDQACTADPEVARFGIRGYAWNALTRWKD